MARSLGQQIALALVPKVSAFLSVLGSGWIILEVVRDRQKQAMVYHRLLLALSILDVIISTAWFMSTWPVPSDVPGLYGNMGNETTCRIQGFVIQLKAGNPFYNTFLALYFVLVVKFGWTEHQIRTTIEPFLHGIPICMALGTATASLVLGLYGNANLWCWIAGTHSNYRLAFFYVWYWASLVAVTLAMVTVYRTVRSQEKASLRYSVKGAAKNTRKVGMQAILYISAYFLTALFATIVRVMQALSDDGFVPFWAVLCMTIFYPSQGLMNFVIYIRPRYLHYRHKNPDWSLWKTITMSLQRAFRVGGGGAGMTTTSMGDENHHDDGDHKLGTPLEDSISISVSSTNDDEVQSNDKDAGDVVVDPVDDVEESLPRSKAQS